MIEQAEVDLTKIYGDWVQLPEDHDDSGVTRALELLFKEAEWFPNSAKSSEHFRVYYMRRHPKQPKTADNNWPCVFWKYKPDTTEVDKGTEKRIFVVNGMDTEVFCGELGLP